jgi:hypothetical protein
VSDGCPMGVRWVSDGCQMGVRWVSDVYLGVVREDAVLDQGGPGHEEDTILGRLDHLHKPWQMGVSDGCQMASDGCQMGVSCRPYRLSWSAPRQPLGH